MISIESILSIDKDDLADASKQFSENDIPQLVEWLSLKEDDIRYRAFLLLLHRSSFRADVCPYWDSFRSKLKSDNSYQRSIGMMLIAENARWDTENRTADVLDECLQLLHDEKPITIRQCIQSLGTISSFQPTLRDAIASALLSFDLMSVKETMRKSILLDILHVLLAINKERNSAEINTYIVNALSGEILDKKSKKQVEALFGE